MTTLFFQFDTTNFWTINWYYVVAVILSTTALIFGIKNYYKKNKENKSFQPSQNHIPINITNNLNSNTSQNDSSSLNNVKNEDRMKSITKILFVDDNHTDYKMVSILKRAGWANTRALKDITDLDNHIVQESDIIFLDINGVGTSMFQDQGLGLATALKTKYPKKKIVLYSAETQGDRFHRALRQVDDCLPKNAEPYQFIDLVENLSKNN